MGQQVTQGWGKRGTVSYSEVSGIVTVYLLSQWLKAPYTPVDGRLLSYNTQLICTGNDSLAVSVKENTSLYRPSRHPVGPHWSLGLAVSGQTTLLCLSFRHDTGRSYSLLL